MREQEDIENTLIATTVVNLAVGVGWCVIGALRWDRRTPLAFKHATGARWDDAETSATALATYRSDISVAFVSAAVNLLATVWPLACLGSKWARDGRAWKTYVAYVTRKAVNPYRWLEYSLSVPLVVLLCAVCLGASDFLFILSQMTLSVAVVALTYGQEREKMMHGRDNAPSPWMPIASAAGIFAGPGALVFWCAHEASDFRRATNNAGWGPVIVFLAGAGATLYVVARSSKYFVALMNGKERNRLTNVTSEITQQIISCVVRVLATILCVPLLEKL